MEKRIYLSPPFMCGSEMQYIQEAFDTNWVAPLGPNVAAFEREMAAYIGMEAALAVNAGTAAIHLILMYLHAQKGDTVFCSDLTFAGSCNPIAYVGAEPVFIDSEPETANMSPQALEDALKWAARENKLPKAVIIVDLYGQSADYDRLLPLCAEYGVPVLEDAAEAVGATYRGNHCGSFGQFGVLSFNGNKILNTSGGGMVLSNDAAAIKKMLFLSTQAREAALHYEHYEIGYNYRLSNICAGIGRGQLAGLSYKIARRKEVYGNYAALFSNTPIRLLPVSAKGEPNYWLSIALLEETDATPADVCAALEKENIEARPAWKPMHMQKAFAGCNYFPHGTRNTGEGFFAHGVCLPSGEALTLEQQQRITDIVKACCVK